MVERMRIDASGNVGIGNAAPGERLVIQGNSVNVIAQIRNSSTVSSTSKTTAVQFIGTDTVGTAKEAGAIFVTPEDNNYVNSSMLFTTRLGDAVSERMRINSAGNVGIGTASPASRLDVNGVIRDSKGDVRVIPQNAQGGAYTLVIGDVGRHISISTGGVTVPLGVFSAGDAVTIYNNSGSNQTITQASSVTLRLAGTATLGNRTLAQRGICTLLCVAANEFVISGAGLT
jgi:hypothetical protein